MESLRSLEGVMIECGQIHQGVWAESLQIVVRVQADSGRSSDKV